VRAAAALLTGLLAAAGARSQAVEPVGAPAAPAAVARSTALTTGLTFEVTGLDTRGRPSGSGLELLATASPSVTLVQRGGRLRGSLFYSGALSTRRGIDDREASDYLNSLSADYVLEAIDGIGFIEARASIRQESIAATDAPIGTLQLSGNRNEVGTFALSPFLRGPLGTLAEYELRVTGNATRGRQDAAGNIDSVDTLVALRSPRGRSLFGWGLTGSRNRVKFSASTAATVTERALAEVTLQPDIDWHLAVFGGQERTDIIGALRREYENYGARVEWTPSPRTSVSLMGEERYFGRGYRVAVEHRLARSALRYSSSRDVTTGSDALGQAATLYELYFAQFASMIPDPVQRDQFVLALIAATGRNRNEVVSGGLFGTGGVSVQQRQELFWTWFGPRLTMTASGFTLDSERLDGGGAFASGRNDNVSQTGYAASVGWRFTPLTSGSLSGSRTMTKDNLSSDQSDLKSLGLSVSTRLGVRTTGALRVGYSVFNGAPGSSYRETLLNAALSLRF
jgi:uncharacterized protein (PEP-CTERM system associated)